MARGEVPPPEPPAAGLLSGFGVWGVGVQGSIRVAILGFGL